MTGFTQMLHKVIKASVEGLCFPFVISLYLCPRIGDLRYVTQPLGSFAARLLQQAANVVIPEQCAL